MLSSTRPPHTVNLPDSYRHWQDAARRLLEPLAALMHPDRADLDIQGAPSDHDRQADRLESFARPLTLAAFWLHSAPRAEDAALRTRLAGWFRSALVLGTDPASPHYWGPDASYHQHHVEMGLAAIALQLAPRELWEPLSADERAQVLRWFGTSRGSGIVNNNHLFMSVHILEFLGRQGAAHRTDRAVIDAHLNQLETMHRGGGWFEDGINQAYDHYNAYAFHFYGLMWAHLHGAQDAARAQRWRDWARPFVADYQHFFAASGEHSAFGRSITYRFNCLNVFGLALAENCTDVAPGVLRRLCTRNLDFFLSRPICNDQGTLAPGFTDVFPKIIEPYSAPASPYWAAKGFTPLLLPPTHAFWTDPEQPLPAERGFVRVMRAPGLVTRSTGDGEIEILNAGSMVGNSQLRYGAWKWSKLSYRTGTHFTYAFPEISNYSLDSALTQQLDDGRVFGRHSTVAVELADDHLGYSYNLGAKIGQVNTSVETFVFWRAGWLLHVHHITPRQPVVLRLGGFALPLREVGRIILNPPLPPLGQVGRIILNPPSSPLGEEGRIILNPPSSDRATERRVKDNPPYLSATAEDGRGTALQLISGVANAKWDTRLDDTTDRRHVAAPFHVTPYVETPRLPAHEPVVLAALSWTGADRAAAAPWHVASAAAAPRHVASAGAAPWHVVSAAAGSWHLTHPLHGEWSLSHWSLPSQSVT